MSLRGGGCGSSQIGITTPVPMKTTTTIPPGLSSQIKFHCERIAKSVVTVVDQENNLMNSFQFFILNQREIWNLANNIQLSAQVFAMVEQSLDTLLTTLQNLIKANITYSLYVAQIITQLSWILFTFYAANEQRYLNIQKQQNLLREMGLIREQLKIEGNADKYLNNIQYELFITKSIITIQPTNSKEAQEILIQFLGGALKSLSTFTVNDDLIQSLKRSVIFIYQEGVKQSRKRKLEVIFTLMKLKYYIMDELERGTEAKILATILSKIYCEIIRESTDWVIWCSWVQVLSSIFQFKQVVEELQIQQQLVTYFSGKEYAIPNYDGKSIVQLNYYQIQNDEILKLIFQSSKPLQEQAKLQFYILSGYGLMHSYEQYYFTKLSATKATNSTLQNAQFSLTNISQLLNLASAIQQGQEQLIEIFKYLLINDQQKIKDAEELIKNLISKTISFLRELEQLIVIYQILTLEIQNKDYEYPETQKILVQYFASFLACLISSQTFSSVDFDSIFQQTEISYLLEHLSQKYEGLDEELKQAILSKTINQQMVDGLIIGLKMIKQPNQIKGDSNYYFCGFYKSLDLILKLKSLINWNLQITVILSVFLKMLSSYKDEEKQQKLKSEIINYSSQLTAYDPLLSTLQFMYSQYQRCQNQNLENKLQVDNTPQLNRRLKVIILEKITQKNVTNQLLVKYLFKETKARLDTSIDQQVCLMLQEQIQDSMTYLNQLCNGIKMVSDMIKSEMENNPELKDDVITLKDQQVFHEIYPNFNTANLNQQGIQISLQKLLVYQDDFLKSFETMKDYIKVEDQDYFYYLEQKKANISNLIELIDIVKQMRVTNDKEMEIAFFLCDDIQKQLSECMKLVKNTSVKLEGKQIDWSEEIKYYDNIVDEIKQIKAKQQEQILQFQNIISNSEKIQSQILNFKTLQKLAAKKPQFNAQFEESQQLLNDSFVDYIGQATDVSIDISSIQALIHQKEFIKYPVDLDSQIYFILNQIDNKDDQKKSNDYFDSLQQGINDVLTNSQWRIRQTLIHELIEMKENCLQQNTVSLSAGLYIRFQVYETDKRVKSLFVEQQRQVSTQLMNKYWPNQEMIIQSKIQEKLRELNELAKQISMESSENNKQKLRKEYQSNEKEIQKILENVQQIGSSLGITVVFLQDLKQDLQRVEAYLSQVSESFDLLSKDLKYLKGRSVTELLELRMKKVLQSRLALNSDNVYIPIKTKEKLNDQTFSIFKTNLFTEDLFGDGEINEFIWKQQKDSFLIHGQAGSGKSTAARKIEEFLWMFYQKNKKQENYIPLIPIFVSLPQLRDPVYGAIEETLKSDNYRFNDRQIKEFQEAIENKKFKLIIIMDSYDELKADYIGLNLNVSNKISKWSCPTDKNKYPKLITTCRTEVFNITGYNTWFLSESNNPLYYKEVKLLKFNQEQIKLYIEQYTQLCVKRDIKEFYFSSNTNQDYLEFEQFFFDLSKAIGFDKLKSQSQFMLNENLIQQILYKCSSFVSKDLQKTLIQLLQEIWSSQQYFKFIQIMKLEKVIETPFMAEIVMAVLPYIVRQRQEINNLKDKFIKRYIYYGKNDQTIVQKSQLDKQALDEWQTIVNNQQFMSEYQSEFSEIQVEKLIFKYYSGSQRFYIIKNALMLEPLSTYDFYGQFLEHYFKRQIYKLRETGELIDYEQIGGELWKFTHNLANEMTFKNMTQVYFQPSGLLFKKTEKDWRDEFFNDDCQEGIYKKLFRKCMPIKQKNGIYSFNHKSLQEFLVAKWFVEFLSNLKIPLDEQIKKATIQYQFFEFAWNFEYLKGPIQFIADKLKYNEELKQKLLALVELTKTDDSIIIGGSNSLLLLNEMDHSFIDMNFSGIRIQDVELSGANFFNCDFTDSTFKGITLSSVNLNLAKIVNASWTDLYLDQLPKISTQLNNIESLTYIEKEKLMLAIDDKQQIKLYDTYKVQESNFKLAIDIQPKFAIRSNNGRFLALVNQQDVLIYDLQDWKAVQKIKYGVIYEQEQLGEAKPQTEQQQFRGCCTFGPDDQSLVFGGPKGAYEMKITIQLVERGGQKKVSDKDRKKGKGKIDSKHDLEEKVEIVQQQPNIVMQKEQFKQIISEQVIGIRSCKMVVMQHASKNFTIYDSQAQIIKSVDSKFRKVTCIDANNEFNLIAVGSGKGEINLFYLSQIEQPISFSAHKDAITELRFQQDGKTFVSCSFDQSIILWSTQQQSQINQANFTTFTKIFSLALVTNSYLAVTGQNNGLLQIWDLDSSDTSLSNIQGHTNKIQCCIFSSDGSFLVSGSDDLLIKIWNTQTGKQIGQNLEKHELPILCLSLTQDMSLLCSGGADGFLHLWDLSIYKIKQTINLFGTKIKQIQIFWSEDSYKILSLTDERLLHLWDENNLSDFTLIYDYKDDKKRLIPYLDQTKLLEISIQSKVQILKSFTLSTYNLTNQIITALAISSNGLQKLIGTNKGYLLVIENKKQVFLKQAHKTKVDVIFVLNENTFITAAQNAILFWRFADFTIQNTFRSKFNKINDYFVANDNLYISIEYTIRIWNITQSSTIKVIKEKKKEHVTSICLKNNTLYGGTQNGKLLIIDLAKSDQYQVIPDIHEGEISKIAWINKYSVLITAGADGFIKQWKDEKPIRIIDSGFPIKQLYIPNDQYYFILHNSEGISMWASENIICLEKIQPLTETQQVLVIFDQRRILWSQDDQVFFIPTLTKKIKYSYAEEGNNHYPEAFALSENQIFTADKQGKIGFWNLKGEKVKDFFELNIEEVAGICLSNDSTKLCVACKNIVDNQLLTVIKVIQLDNLQIVLEYDFNQISINSLNYLNDKTLIIATNTKEQQVIFYNEEDNSIQYQNDHNEEVKGATVNQKTNSYATFSFDNSIRYYQRSNQGYAMKFSMAYKLKFECQDTIVENSKVVSKTGIDLQSLFKHQRVNIK